MELKVAQKTKYPWDGERGIAVAPSQPSQFTFYLRIPGWADGAKVAVNGKAVAEVRPGTVSTDSRQWSAGDVIRMQVEMPVQVLQANPQVADDAARRGATWSAGVLPGRN